MPPQLRNYPKANKVVVTTALGKYEVLVSSLRGPIFIDGHPAIAITISHDAYRYCQDVARWFQQAKVLGLIGDDGRLSKEEAFEVSLSGKVGEMGACYLFCGHRLFEWSQTIAVVPTPGVTGSNAGNDLRLDWLNSDLPNEIKTLSSRLKEYLCISAPSHFDGNFTSSHIPKARYVLMQPTKDGCRRSVEMVGWCTHQQICDKKNPTGKHEHWGIHKSKLWKPEDLMDLLAKGFQ